ncbi:UNVERIFIED_CONTAM: acetylxylan esterase [Microbacterium sp. SLM126]
MITDMPLRELTGYLPERAEPLDFDEFWAGTLAEARQHPLDANFERVPTRLRTIDTYDVSFRGFGGHVIKGWLNLPHGAEEPLPCVVEYLGYGGGRGNPQDWLLFASAGYAHFIMDSRGQGGGWRRGDTPDPGAVGGTHHPGFVTLGIEAPESHYYRRVYTDAVRAIEAAATAPAVDADRIVVAGTSQGGGIALAAAGLSPTPVAVMPSVPFLCHFSRAVRITDTLPYFEVARYLRANPLAAARSLEVLEYFDGVNLAARATADSLFSVALMDQTCPPSTVYAAYNHYAGEKDIRVWEFNDHDGAMAQHTVEQLEFLARRFA